MMRGLLLTACIVAACSAESSVQVTGNPHMSPTKSGPSTSMQCSASSTGGSAFDHLINPALIVTTPLATQPDTFRAMTVKKIMNVPAPIYTFKQPARLSSLELPFKVQISASPLRCTCGWVWVNVCGCVPTL